MSTASKRVARAPAGVSPRGDQLRLSSVASRFSEGPLGERFCSLIELKLKGQQGGGWPRFGQVKLAGVLSRFIGGAEQLSDH